MTEKIDSVHKTVLLNETIDGLNLKDGATVIDATFGGGGHSREICNRYKNVKIIAIDQDRGAWEKAKSKFEKCNCNITFLNKNFADIGELENIDGIIFDLGLSSDQLENSGRGFTFMKNEPLLMTMKENPQAEDLTAMDIVNGWSEKSLADIIYGYGEEKYRGRIAREIVESRKKKKIESTFDLVSIIERAVPGSYRKGKLHFATRTFQAIRIAVNDELGVLEKGLAGGFKILNKGGRMSVISFHSLEDRIVKKFYKEKEKNNEAKLINKKVILASEEELKINNRSRSAKLRILEKI
ncbi:MAG: 16S rRNA (cytosine(1402)-N(4))-methyltransferase RsmH [bacterium]